MNNPLAVGSPDYRRLSELNRATDELDISRPDTKQIPNSKSYPRKIYVLNLPEREDRWIRFQSMNQELFEIFDVVRFDALKTSDVQDAIFKSFKTCIGKAEDETFIVMEDDAFLVEGAIQHLHKIWEQIPGDWDVLFGNHYFYSKLEIINDVVAKPIGRASTANFGIYSKSLLPKLDDLSMREDRSLSEWDHFLTGNPSINNYVLWPMVSREVAGFSDHRGREMNINLRLREHRYRFNFLDNEKFYEAIWKT